MLNKLGYLFSAITIGVTKAGGWVNENIALLTFLMALVFYVLNYCLNVKRDRRDAERDLRTYQFNQKLLEQASNAEKKSEDS